MCVYIYAFVYLTSDSIVTTVVTLCLSPITEPNIQYHVLLEP